MAMDVFARCIYESQVMMIAIEKRIESELEQSER